MLAILIILTPLVGYPRGQIAYFWGFADEMATWLNAPVNHCWLTLIGIQITLQAIFAALLFSERAERTSTGNYQTLGDIPLDSSEDASGTLWYRSGFYSLITFAWMGDLVRTGVQRPLQLEDCLRLKPADTCEEATSAFWDNWEREKLPHSSGRQASTVRAFARTYAATYFAVPGVFRVLKSAFMLVTSVYILPLLLSYIGGERGEARNYLYGLGLVTALTLATLLQSVCHHQFFFHSYRMGLQMRAAYMSAVYRKVMALRNNRLPVGEIVNMTSNDSSRLIEASMNSHHLWATVLEVVVIVSFLFARLGVSCVPGLLIVGLFFPLQGLAGRVAARIRKVAMQAVDARVRLMSEVLTSIKLVKLYAWEGAFVASVTEARRTELRQLRLIANWKVVNMLGGLSMPAVASVASFITFALLGNPLDPTVVFSTLTLFNQLKNPMAVFPKGVKTCAETLVSLRRLQAVLEMPELAPSPAQTASRSFAVAAEDATFTWGEDLEPVVRGVSLRLAPGQIIGVVGAVGSGKSSLLSAIMNEMVQVGGKLEDHGGIAYSPQQAWIVNATFRENVLFGAPFHEERYRAVVSACALEEDLRQLPGGDLTEIGERGVNLSGGQKQRLSLARAVYSDSQIYLLDDPLGAVDTRVGRFLFQQCIRGLLREKAVILVTHHLHHLRDVDRILVMRAGAVVEEGSFQELVSQGGEFARLVSTFAQAGEGEGKDWEEPGEDGSSKGPEGQPPRGPLISQPTAQNVYQTTVTEDRNTGAISWKTYRQYCVEAGGLGLSLFIVALYAATQAARVGIDVWLSHWVQEDTGGGGAGPPQAFYMGVYAGITVLYVALLLTTGLLFYRSALTASTRIHNSVFQAVLAAPMSFFDSTPVGRVVNRFANDMDQMDDSLTDTLDQALYFGVQVVGTVVLVVVVFPQFLVVLAPLGYVYYRIQRYFRHTSRELKRLDGIARSPLYAHLSATLQGLSTIRAYKAQGQFEEKNRDFMNQSNSVSFTFWGANRWLGFRLDMLALVVVLGASLFSIFVPVSPSVAGLVLSYVLQLTGQFQWCIRQMVEAETKMTSVERLLHYINHLEPEEKEEEKEEDGRPPAAWPRTGDLRFEGYSLRYRPGLPLVLKDLRLEIRDREKIGVVGRTGAGKSSIATALFRMAEGAAGRILLDHLDISQVPLRDLRSRLSIIPQDPVLFIGTIRSNLDPAGSFSDQQIWEVLRKIHFDDAVRAFPQQLDFAINEGGENLSLGQRQLFCVARALLRGSKVILMDEATASVDLHTDHLIQQAIRESFQDQTVITIAHRINTIIDADRVLVLDQGEVAEFDTPASLLARPGSLFGRLVEETGRANADLLRAEALKPRKPHDASVL